MPEGRDICGSCTVRRGGQVLPPKHRKKRETRFGSTPALYVTALWRPALEWARLSTRRRVFQRTRSCGIGVIAGPAAHLWPQQCGGVSMTNIGTNAAQIIEECSRPFGPASQPACAFAVLPHMTQSAFARPGIRRRVSLVTRRGEFINGTTHAYRHRPSRGDPGCGGQRQPDRRI